MSSLLQYHFYYESALDTDSLMVYEVQQIYPQAEKASQKTKFQFAYLQDPGATGTGENEEEAGVMDIDDGEDEDTLLD